MSLGGEDKKLHNEFQNFWKCQVLIFPEMGKFHKCENTETLDTQKSERNTAGRHECMHAA